MATKLSDENAWYNGYQGWMERDHQRRNRRWRNAVTTVGLATAFAVGGACLFIFYAWANRPTTSPTWQHVWTAPVYAFLLLWVVSELFFAQCNRYSGWSETRHTLKERRVDDENVPRWKTWHWEKVARHLWCLEKAGDTVNAVLGALAIGWTLLSMGLMVANHKAGMAWHHSTGMWAWAVLGGGVETALVLVVANLWTSWQEGPYNEKIRTKCAQEHLSTLVTKSAWWSMVERQAWEEWPNLSHGPVGMWELEKGEIEVGTLLWAAVHRGAPLNVLEGLQKRGATFRHAMAWTYGHCLPHRNSDALYNVLNLVNQEEWGLSHWFNKTAQKPTMSWQDYMRLVWQRCVEEYRQHTNVVEGNE